MLPAPQHSLSGTSSPHPHGVQGPPRPHSRAGEGWRGSGRPLCRQLAPAGKGINITKSRSKRRAAGRGLCGAPRAGGARGRRLSRTRAAGLAGRRQWVQAYVPDACACACMRVRACLGLRPPAWDADAPASPAEVGRSPAQHPSVQVGLLTNAVLLTLVACSQRGPHLGAARRTCPRPGLTLDSRPFCLAEAPIVVDRSISNGSIFPGLDIPGHALTRTMDQSVRPGSGREPSSLRF